MTQPTDSSTETTASLRRDFAFFSLCTLLLLPSIWSPCSITGQDEYWLSFRTVLEMQERGEWLTPYVNGEVRLQKPPLLYWLLRVAFLAFGSNPFAARIWTVLFGAGMALFSAKLARRYQGSGYLAGLMVAAAAGVMVDARRAMFDLPVGCLCTMAVYYSVAWHANGRLRTAMLAATALALGTMTKGPVALWFFAAPMLAALLVRRRKANGSSWHWLLALCWFLLLALPWPLWVQAAHPEFWNVMQTQAEHREFAWPNFKRLTSTFGALLGLSVPWSLAVLGGAARMRPRREPSNRIGQDDPARWLVLWIVIGFAPFLFMNSFERYMLALVCPMAVLAANWLLTRAAKTQRLQLTLAVALTSVPALVFAAFAMWFGFAYLLPAIAGCVAVAAFRMARRQRPDPIRVAAACAVLLTLLLGGIYPSLGINQLPDDLPDDIATTPVQTFARPQPGMLSITLGRSVPQMWGGPVGLGERLAGFHGYLFVLERDMQRVESVAQAHGVPLIRVGTFRSFYSRKAWLKFYREGLQFADWSKALRNRSAETLKPMFAYYRLP